MTPDPGEPYYAAYEKRYRSVYAQGVRYWSAFPEEMAEVERQVDAFLDASGLRPDAHLIEFGCGEGFVARMLGERGYRYTGVDLAPSAVARARERVAPFGERVHVVVADIASGAGMPEPPAGGYDAAIDVMCLHMLVVDADRRAYLRNACRVLKPGAPMLFCHECCDADAYRHPVASYEEWVSLSGSDYATPVEREAWDAGQRVRVMLPLIAARPRTVEQYREEMGTAGFADFALAAPPEGGWVSFVVRRDERAP